MLIDCTLDNKPFLNLNLNLGVDELTDGLITESNEIILDETRLLLTYSKYKDSKMSTLTHNCNVY